jgi:hypothetical protein
MEPDQAAPVGPDEPVGTTRLESGDHEPSLSTLARLSAGLGLDFSVEVKPGRMRLRYSARDGSERKRA